ncbi:MAG: hypothetical protein V1792_27135 [Pseudomonadota bacterium]
MRRITLADAVLFIVAAEAFLMAFLNSRSNTDLFLGLAAGRDVLARGPAAPDQWSFTHAGGMWIDQSWLSHLAYYLSYAGLHEYGPVLVKLVLLSGCAAITALRCRDVGARSWAAGVSLSLALLAVAPLAVIRAENFGIFYFVLFVWLIQGSHLSKAVRYGGLLIVTVLWSNCHGSFMLGTALLALKTAFAAGRKLSGFAGVCSGDGSWRCSLEWFALLVCSCVLAAVLSPFGMDNLLMPFVQVGAGQVTASSADWLPLTTCLFSGMPADSSSVIFYVAYLAVFVISVLMLLIMMKLEARERSVGAARDTFPARVAGGAGFDWIMETAVVVITMVLAFRFKRLIGFSAFALVPVMAVVLTALGRRLADRLGPGKDPASRRRIGRLAATVASAVLCLATGWILFSTTLIRYLPNNPMTPPRSMIRELMSFDTFSPEVAAFLQRNAIGGRIFAGWEISSYLLHEIPGIRLFMDPRDQSFYPPRVISDFFKILGIHQASEQERLNLLDDYKVSALVLTTYPYDFNLGMGLLQSGKWGCVFKDDYSMVLVRSDDPRFSDALKQGRFSALHYADDDERLRSEAFHSNAALRSIDRDLLGRVQALVQRKPRPNFYRIIGTGFGFPSKCLKEGQVKYLVSEAQRLAKISPFYRHGANEVTQSIIAVMEILAVNADRCTDRAAGERFRHMGRLYEQDYATMSRMYYGDIY